MAEVIELKGFMIEELYTINKHFTDLPSGKFEKFEKFGKFDKEIATLREDCTSKNYIKILVKNFSKHTNSFYKINQQNNNTS